MVIPNKDELRDFCSRGVTQVTPRDEFERRVNAGERLRIYLGVDPTGADIHLGHAVILRKLRQMQLWGHEIIFLIGDFTAQIGDPSGRDVLRKPLLREEILDNAKDYQEQVGAIVPFEGENPATLMYNSTWLSKLTFQDLVTLAGNFTVQQMLERGMFQERLAAERPIGLHEFLYPLMQGYDSVAMDVDMEIGGNDQLFNIMAGRTLEMSLRGKSKIVFTCDLLEGTDGRKMSKSYGNIIRLSAPAQEMYGQIMSLDDALIGRYFTLCTTVSPHEIGQMQEQMKAGFLNPRDAKARLAREIVVMYHGSDVAEKAVNDFESVFKKKEFPRDLMEVAVPLKEAILPDILVESGLSKSKSDARRLIEQGGVKVNQRAVKDWKALVHLHEGDILQVGKRRFVRVK